MHEQPLAAGDFGQWLAQVQVAIREGGATDVACGTCVACCSSAQFVHVAPDEHDALAHIPSTLLFPAPGAPRGHVLMGYDEHGRCPMLRPEGCSIYEHRPRTCRTRMKSRHCPCCGKSGAGSNSRSTRWERL